MWFLTIFINFFLSILMVIIVRTYEGQPRPKYIFNKCGTSTFFLLYRGLVHHHHRILNIINITLINILVYKVCMIFNRKQLPVSKRMKDEPPPLCSCVDGLADKYVISLCMYFVPLLVSIFKKCKLQLDNSSIELYKYIFVKK